MKNKSLKSTMSKQILSNIVSRMNAVDPMSSEFYSLFLDLQKNIVNHPNKIVKERGMCKHEDCKFWPSPKRETDQKDLCPYHHMLTLSNDEVNKTCTNNMYLHKFMKYCDLAVEFNYEIKKYEVVGYINRLTCETNYYLRDIDKVILEHFKFNVDPDLDLEVKNDDYAKNWAFAKGVDLRDGEVEEIHVLKQDENVKPKRVSRCKKIVNQYDRNNKLMRSFDSASECAKCLGISQGKVSNILRNDPRYKQHPDYILSYGRLEEEE